MPRREDIEKFKEILNSLGGEPEIMAQRSRAIEEVAPPEGAQAPGEGAGGGEEELPAEQEFGLDLTSLPEIEPETLPGPGAPAAPETPPGAEGPLVPEGPFAPEGVPAPPSEPALEGIDAGLDFSSLFGEEAAAPPIQEMEAPPAAEEFQIPEVEEPALQADLSQMEVVPEEPAPAPTAEGEAEAGAFDFGALELEVPPAETGAAEAPPPEAGPPGPEAAPSEAAPFEAPFEGVPAPSEEEMAGIELPNLEDLSLAEPSAAPEERPVEGAPEEALPEAPLEGLPGEGPAAPEAAEMPSLEGLDLEREAGLEAPSPEAEAFEAPPSVPEAQAPSAAELPGEIPSEAPPGPSAEGLGEGGLADLGLDQLAFPEVPEGFGAAEIAPPEEKAPKPERPRPAKPPREPAAEEAALPELAGAEGEISLTREQFARLRKTLQSLPRNLKIAVQDVIADGRAAGADLARLVSLLVSGAAAQEIADVVSRITGRRVRIPAGYEKRTGMAFEAERGTFAYAFRENILPLLRVFALTILAAFVVGYMGYRYVYRPLYALSNYRIGYSHILGDRYTLANESFDRAVGIWPMKRWYYSYADEFAAKRQYILAEQKYDQALARWPGDRKALLDYARMETTPLADYKKADDLLKALLDRNEFDYDGLLAAGDNNLEWAAADPARFEPARVDYATLIDRYGARHELLFRMMRYFIRTNNAQEIERLRIYFDSREGLRVDPFVYAELGGYLIDHRRLDYVKKILLKADAAQTTLPEIHYNLARYYRLVDAPQDELLALQATEARIKATESVSPLTAKRLAMEIDTYTRLGELYDARQEYINGEKNLQTAIAIVEENQRNRLIAAGPIFGRPYADLGDLNYYVVGDLVTARALYEKAIANSYVDPALSYKIGYTQYAAGNFAAALASFMTTENEWGAPRDPDASPSLVMSEAADIDYTGKPPVNLLYAIGNCFYQRGDLFASQGYYLRLRDRLETLRAATGPLDPEDKPEHRSLLETLVKIYNNLGVVTYRLAARTGDRTKRSEGLVYITTAAQIADTLTRTPGRKSTDVAKNLPFVNQRAILYPVSGFVPQISAEIPRDLGALSW